jgi:hypothetical protein
LKGAGTVGGISDKIEMHLFADGFSRVSLSGGVLRLTLIQTTGESQTQEVVEQLLPIVRAEAFAQSLNTTLQKLSEQIQEDQRKAAEQAEQA